ncbi:unnamed protein product [Linum trigynum]|uniref:Uncharacterized protein n=1 Tax=Linum trigynum TaxID=586398 RepID=A0AAV2F5I2_9ROSI
MITSNGHHLHHHKVGCFLLILVLICSSRHGFVGARRLVRLQKVEGDEIEHQEDHHGPTAGSSEQSNNGFHSEDGDFFATVDRAVPSCPDPLHNK